jgi:hypothetical protein
MEPANDDMSASRSVAQLAELPLAPLRYQRAVVDHLKSEERELWTWFKDSRRRPEKVEAIRLDLLKSTYRLEPDTHPALHALAADVARRLGLSVPIALYQMQTGALNAALTYLPGEAHVLFGGPVFQVLAVEEQAAVLAHELAHFVLYEQWDGDYLIAAELLRALAHDAQAHCYQETERLFSLYTEVFADRAALLTSRDEEKAITALIKMETGLTQVSAASYLRQAEEIFAKGPVQTDGITHPEAYIRARALRLWHEKGEAAAAEIEDMIQGGLSLGRLDLLGQRRVAAVTRRVIEALLVPHWMRSEAVVAHARLFFDDFTAVEAEPAPLEHELETADKDLRDYLCYVMLDFVAVDRELADPALASALMLSRRLGLQGPFAEIATRELQLGKKVFARIERDAEQIVAGANAASVD